MTNSVFHPPFSQTSFQWIGRLFVLPIVALVLAFTTVSLSTSTPAEAGIGKKIKVGTKVLGKGFRKMEKAGRKLSRKKGVVGKLGRAMKKTGRAGRKGTNGVRRGMKTGSRFVNRQLGKSRVGRGIKKVHRGYKKVRRNSVNRAFKRCNASFCEDAKELTDAFVPG